MKTLRTVAELRAQLRDWRQGGDDVGLVPTMGGLHDGHLALVRACKWRHARTVATLFVNPTQFAPNEDLASYPRDEAGDTVKFESEGIDLLFAPAAAEMYPEGHSTKVEVEGLSDILDGEFRPPFFIGVATVVTKLLLQALPDAAYFGEKDYQQLCVVKRMVRDLDIPVEIAAVPTVREPDGLAMSSRNRYLTAAEREVAPALYRAISAVAEAVQGGADPSQQEEKARAEIVGAGFRSVDYVAVRDAETLQPVFDSSSPARVLAAAWLGKARLIDNVAV